MLIQIGRRDQNDFARERRSEKSILRRRRKQLFRHANRRWESFRLSLSTRRLS